MDNILDFSDTSFAYKTGMPPAVKNVTLGIRRGEITAVLGPNGAGKTTLLQLGLGWLRPTSGEVRLEGRPIESFSRSEIGRTTGLVPQTEHITFVYSLLEYVLLGRTPHLRPLEIPGPKDSALALEALRRVGLEKAAERPIFELSGGERQLLMIARTLAQAPRLIILDEPTSHLDLANKVRLVRLLKQLAQDGISVVFSTHEPEVALAAAARVAVISDGRIAVEGACRDVITAENLETTFGVPVRILKDAGDIFVSWRDREKAEGKA